jgi:hypothetical protein
MIDEDDFSSNWWNEIWQGKPKYSEKTYPSATLSTTMSWVMYCMQEENCGASRCLILFYFADLIIFFFIIHHEAEREVFLCINLAVLATELLSFIM